VAAHRPPLDLSLADYSTQRAVQELVRLLSRALKEGIENGQEKATPLPSAQRPDPRTKLGS